MEKTDKKRILAIGDIHGNFNKLYSLFNKIDFNPSTDLLIFLGDYIDRGSEPLKCLDFVINLKKKYPDSVIPLKGNHEAMMLDYFESRGNDSCWLSNGGKITLSQFNEKNKNEKENYFSFIENLDIFYNYDNKYIFVHAGINPKESIDMQSEDNLLWIREDFINNYNPVKFNNIKFIIGHTPTQCINKNIHTPINLKNNILMCDTGSYLENGKISCIDVLSNKFWQD